MSEEIQEETQPASVTITVIDTIVQFSGGTEVKLVLEAESAANLRKSFSEGSNDVVTVINYSLFERKTIAQIDLSNVVLIVSVPNEKVQNPENF